jgi:hypothetical protein
VGPASTRAAGQTARAPPGITQANLVSHSGPETWEQRAARLTSQDRLPEARRRCHRSRTGVQAGRREVGLDQPGPLDVRRHRDQGNPQAFLIRGGRCGFPAGTQPRKSPDAQPSAGFLAWIGQRAAARSAFRLCLDRADLCTAIRNLEGAPPPLCEALRRGWGGGCERTARQRRPLHP